MLKYFLWQVPREDAGGNLIHLSGSSLIGLFEGCITTGEMCLYTLTQGCIGIFGGGHQTG